MNRSPRPGSRLMRWLQRGEQAASAPRQPDPADMGTCFGLDMTFDEAPVDPFARKSGKAGKGDKTRRGVAGEPSWKGTVPGAI